MQVRTTPDYTGKRGSGEEICHLPFHSSSFHDLAGPVNQVSNTLELFQRRYQGVLDSEARILLGLMRTSADRLQNLMSGMQAYAGTLGSPAGYRRCEGDALLEAAKAALDITIQETNAHITQGPLPAVKCDPQQVVCVFTGLIDNSLKFRGEQKPEIHVSATLKEEWWVFSFRDNGIGIAMKDAERVFHMFKRLHGDRYRGAGVGLAIAKRVIEEHGGSIWLESEPGRGAEFFFTLPAE